MINSNFTFYRPSYLNTFQNYNFGYGYNTIQSFLPLQYTPLNSYRLPSIYGPAWYLQNNLRRKHSWTRSCNCEYIKPTYYHREYIRPTFYDGENYNRKNYVVANNRRVQGETIKQSNNHKNIRVRLDNRNSCNTVNEQVFLSKGNSANAASIKFTNNYQRVFAKNLKF